MSDTDTGTSTNSTADPAGLADALARAAQAVRGAASLLFTAGAGMGVDSGLPDFRGPEGFWQAYPAAKKLGLRFEQLASPRWFAEDPGLAWGFYGHRLSLYRRTEPHDGFAILSAWAAAREGNAFVFTSNVDGHFQRAGFSEESIHECHGSLHWLQCTDGSCGHPAWPADGFEPRVDLDRLRAAEPWPECPGCGALARPNVLMFGDHSWNSARSDEQESRLDEWLSGAPRPITVVECGAGMAVPTVRWFGERMVRREGAFLVRINPRDESGGGLPAASIASIPLGAAAGLLRLGSILGSGL